MVAILVWSTRLLTGLPPGRIVGSGQRFDITSLSDPVQRLLPWQPKSFETEVIFGKQNPAFRCSLQQRPALGSSDENANQPSAAGLRLISVCAKTADKAFGHAKPDRRASPQYAIGFRFQVPFVKIHSCPQPVALPHSFTAACVISHYSFLQFLGTGEM